MKIPLTTVVLVMALLFAPAVRGDSPAVQAINALGIDLLKQTDAPPANALLSPYSIQMALAMTCAGAAGQTRAEMARVLHYSPAEGAMDQSFSALQGDLNNFLQRQSAHAEAMKQYGVTNQPLTLLTANRLFGQQGYEFCPPFLARLQANYQAPLEPLDFLHDASGATRHINAWVARQTRDHIPDLIPSGALDRATRLVLVNAVYFKAAWIMPFKKSDTQPLPFHRADGTTSQVPTMFQHHSFGYARQDGWQALAIPYEGYDLALLILLPDAPDGLAELERKLTPDLLADCADLPASDVNLWLPKFKLAPPVLALSKNLQALGMKTAFDVPPGSANFDQMAPRRPDDYLYISQVFHQTYLNLDEAGTEAAAATAAVMMSASAVMMQPPKPVEFRVDHPFLFAIQHRPSGACLFLGRVTDPR